jgi:hypothetical protein
MSSMHGGLGRRPDCEYYARPFPIRTSDNLYKQSNTNTRDQEHSKTDSRIVPGAVFTFSDKVENTVRNWLIGGNSGHTRR